MQGNIFFERVPKNAPKYKAVNSYLGDARGYNNINSKSKRQQRTRMRKTVNDRFFEELCTEIDLFDQEKSFPEWIFDFREKILSKISKKFRLMCQILKDARLSFKIKYPIEIEGKWKFADIYIPEYNLVVLLVSEYEIIGLPCHSMGNRELFFSSEYRTLTVMDYELPRLEEKLKAKLDKM